MGRRGERGGGGRGRGRGQFPTLPGLFGSFELLWSEEFIQGARKEESFIPNLLIVLIEHTVPRIGMGFIHPTEAMNRGEKGGEGGLTEAGGIFPITQGP